MNYEQIKRVIESYGEDYLFTGEMKQIFRIIKDSPAMQEQVEQGVTEEWIKLAMERQKIYVYHDARKQSILSDGTKQFPFMEVTFQDEAGFNGRPATRTPVLRYVTQQYKQPIAQERIAQETEYRMRYQKSQDER